MTAIADGDTIAYLSAARNKGGCNATGPLLSIISCPPTARSRGRLLQTSDGSILGRDDDESKAASGGRRRNRKMRWGWCGCQQQRDTEAKLMIIPATTFCSMTIPDAEKPVAKGQLEAQEVCSSLRRRSENKGNVRVRRVRSTDGDHVVASA